MPKEYFIDLSKPEKLSSEQKEKLSQLLAYNIKLGGRLTYSINKIHKDSIYGVPNSNGKEVIILSHSLIKVTAPDDTIKFYLLEHSNKSKLFGKGSYGKVKDSNYVFYFQNNELTYHAENNVCKIEKEHTCNAENLTITAKKLLTPVEKNTPTQQVKNEANLSKKRIPEAKNLRNTAKKSLTSAEKETFIQSVENESKLFNEIYSSTPSNIALASSHSNEFMIKSYLFMPKLGEMNIHKLNFRNLTYGEKLNLILALIEATKSFHEKNILHGDIKPHNFVYCRKDNKIHLIDFGFANKINPAENIKLYRGTLYYMAPDDFSSYASDLYSLGGCIAEIMGGRKVFTKKKAAGSNNLMKSSPYYLNEIESYCFTPTLQDKKNIADIKSIIEKMTNVDPNNRGTIQEIHNSFKKLQNEFLLNELNKLNESLVKIEEDINVRININTANKPLDLGTDKSEILQALLTELSKLRENIVIDLHPNQISCEKYEDYFKQAFKLLHQENVNKIYEHRNHFVKFFNALTRPLSFIFGLLSHNELLTKRGFFLTKSSKILLNAEKTLALSQQSVRLNLTKS